MARNIRLSPGDEATLDFGNLQPLCGNIDVQLQFNAPKGAVTPGQAQVARIIVEAMDPVVGERQKMIDELGMTGMRPAGYYRVRVEHPDFRSAEQIVEIKPNETLHLPVLLDPKPATLVLNVVPDTIDAVVIADGRQIPVVPGRSTRVELTPYREHEIQVLARDHFSVRTEVTLGANESTLLRVPLQAVPGPLEGAAYTIPYLNLELVWVPPGSFTMGSPETEASRLPTEGPLTNVTISNGFWIGKYEVKQREYLAIMGNNPSRFSGADRPVENVSWHDAVSFTERLNAMERDAGRLPAGYQYRLPTEAEWEYAARGGSDAPFNFGTTASPEHANFRGRYPRDYGAVQEPSAVVGTAPVGRYSPNSFGLHDIHGNVREWCLDWYQSRLPGGTQRDPVIPRPDGSRFHEQDHARKVYRGGSYEDFAHNARSASRGEGMRPSTTSPATGFRIVLAPVVEADSQ